VWNEGEKKNKRKTQFTGDRLVGEGQTKAGGNGSLKNILWGKGTCRTENGRQKKKKKEPRVSKKPKLGIHVGHERGKAGKRRNNKMIGGTKRDSGYQGKRKKKKRKKTVWAREP